MSQTDDWSIEIEYEEFPPSLAVQRLRIRLCFKKMSAYGRAIIPAGETARCHRLLNNDFGLGRQDALDLLGRIAGTFAPIAAMLGQRCIAIDVDLDGVLSALYAASPKRTAVANFLYSAVRTNVSSYKEMT